MSRIDVLFQHPKRTLGVLVLVLVAVGVAVGSGANFSASSANPSNTFTAGTLTMSNSNDAAAILSVGGSPGWKPGDTTSGTVDIKNTGSLAGTFSLNRSALSDTNPNDTPSGPSPAPADPLSGKIDLVIHDCGTFVGPTPPSCATGGTDVYTGTLAALSSSQALGNYAANEQHRYKFTATFNSSAGNVYQAANSTATFTWNAVQ
jgi:spore coat-associated protein N